MLLIPAADHFAILGNYIGNQHKNKPFPILYFDNSQVREAIVQILLSEVRLRQATSVRDHNQAENRRRL